MYSFAGKHAAIVGATGTIGFAISRAFASHGAVCSLLGRTAVQSRHHLEPQLQPYAGAAKVHSPSTSSSPSSSLGPSLDNGKDSIPSSHQFIKLDMSKREVIKSIFAGSRSEGTHVVGPVDILVNCAGISQTTVLKRTPDEELEGLVNTNLLAAMLICKHAKMRQHGVIINVSSLMADKGVVGASAYAATKAGLVGFARSLCHELAPRSIRVNTLLPGWVDSPMWNDLKPDLKQKYLDETPSRRVAHPDEIAAGTLFLASNKFANNCVLNLDGGLSAS